MSNETIYEKQLKYKSFYDASFLTGDSPATHDVNAGLSRNGIDGFIDNWGAGDLIYQISADGTTYGDNVYLPSGATDELQGVSGGGIGDGIDSIKITWVSNTSYTIRVR